MNEIGEMKLDMVKNLAVLLMDDDKNLGMNEALNIIFNSNTYQKVMDNKAGLYYQSPRYVYSFLTHELSSAADNDDHTPNDVTLSAMREAQSGKPLVELDVDNFRDFVTSL